MTDEKQASPKEVPESESSYFELLSYWGITKHMGGLKATKELIELCRIDETKYVLIIGSGTGVTPCYLAQKLSCKVVGVDLSERMIERSQERAKRKGVENRTEFRIADAQNLPFADALFDVVICESVNAFIEDKQRAISEYVRVIKPGGYVGFNEATWIKPPPPELVKYLYRVMGAKFPMHSGWKELLEGSGLRETTARIHKTSILSQWANEVRQIDFLDFIRAWGRFCCLFVRSPASRRFVKEALSIPKSIFSFFKYFGYGIYVGRK